MGTMDYKHTKCQVMNTPTFLCINIQGCNTYELNTRHARLKSLHVHLGGITVSGESTPKKLSITKCGVFFFLASITLEIRAYIDIIHQIAIIHAAQTYVHTYIHTHM